MTFLTVPFFAYIDAILPVWPAVVVVDVVALYLLLFREKFDPRTFIFWVAAVFVLPFVGFVAYLLWGCTLLVRRHGRLKLEGEASYMEAESDPVPEGDRALAGCIESAGGDVYTGGNSAELRWNAEEGLEGMVRDIESAEISVHVETYGTAWPPEVSDALAAAARRGVDVRVVTSVLGFGRTPGIRDLRGAGVRTATMNSTVRAVLSVGTKDRCLRRTVVVDGRVAYVPMSSMLRVEGPAASRAERRFLSDWHYASGEALEEPPEPAAAEGGCGVQIAVSGPDAPGQPMLHGYAGLISGARERLYVTLPYMIPDDEMYGAIKQAVISGADVRILVPRRTWHWYQAWNSLAASNPLMTAGARVYFVDRAQARCVAVADGRTTVFGTGVFNSRSLGRDYGMNVVLYSEEVASKVEEDFLREVDCAVECHSEEYSSRTLSDKVRIGVARFLMFLN